LFQGLVEQAVSPAFAEPFPIGGGVEPRVGTQRQHHLTRFLRQGAGKHGEPPAGFRVKAAAVGHFVTAADQVFLGQHHP